MTFSWLHVITVKCEEIQIGAGLEKKKRESQHVL